MRRMSSLGLLLGLIILVSSRASACSLCDGRVLFSPTFRQEAALTSAKAILHGTISNPRTTSGLSGQTDFHIKTSLRTDPAIKGKTTLVLPRYLPVTDKAKPPHFLLFCDVDGGKLDPYRGVILQGPKSVDYIQGALKQNSKDPVGNLVFFFKYLDSDDPEIARDAFLEYARAADADIARVAPKLDPTKLREWIKDPKTPAFRLGLYAMLLGACGKEEDIKFLRSLLDGKEERYLNAADGILAGYLTRKPKEGWELIQSILSDGRKPLLFRLTVMRALRFAHGADPSKAKPHLVKVMKTLLAQGEMADLAVEDLRRWNVWDLTPEVLKIYGQKGYESPLMARSIIRYALSCPATQETKAFLAARRKSEADVVKEVEEGLKFEKMK